MEACRAMAEQTKLVETVQSRLADSERKREAAELSASATRALLEDARGTALQQQELLAATRQENDSLRTQLDAAVLAKASSDDRIVAAQAESEGFRQRYDNLISLVVKSRDKQRTAGETAGATSAADDGRTQMDDATSSSSTKRQFAPLNRQQQQQQAQLPLSAATSATGTKRKAEQRHV